MPGRFEPSGLEGSNSPLAAIKQLRVEKPRDHTKGAAKNRRLVNESTHQKVSRLATALATWHLHSFFSPASHLSVPTTHLGAVYREFKQTQAELSLFKMLRVQSWGWRQYTLDIHSTPSVMCWEGLWGCWLFFTALLGQAKRTLAPRQLLPLWWELQCSQTHTIQWGSVCLYYFSADLCEGRVTFWVIL